MDITPKILVLGASDAQGAAVARHLLTSPRYEVRCLVDDADGDVAHALESAGAQLIEGTCDRENDVTRAMADCHYVFAATDEHREPEQTYAQGRHIVDAICAHRVHHTVFSTLPHAKLLSGGRASVRTLDTQARIEEYARSRGIAATYVHVAQPFELFIDRLRQTHNSGSSEYTVGLPQGSTPLATVATEDVGGVVAGIFAESFWYRGKTVGVVGDERRCDEYATLMSRVLNRKIVYEYVPHDRFAAVLSAEGNREANDLADLFDFNRSYVLTRGADLVKSRELYPEIRTFERWLRSRAADLRQRLLH